MEGNRCSYLDHRSHNAVVALLADIPTIVLPTQPRSVPPSDRWEVASCRPGRPSRAVLRRRRLMAFGLVIILVLGVSIGLQAALGRIGGGPLATTDAPGGLQPAASHIWIVRPGDSLWSIAQAVDPHGDVRPLVDRLVAETGNAALYPGEAVALPRP
jgi:hypothetical protein